MKPVVDYPNWLRAFLIGTAFIHDLAIICMGWAALRNSPPSIEYTLDHLSTIWGWMLIFGGIISLIGAVLRNVRVETTGCATTSAAKVVWIVAISQSAGGSPFGTWVLAFALAAGAAGTMWRFAGLWVGYYLKVRD